MVLVLEGHGEIEGNHENFMPLPTKFGDECVIAKTVAAVHPSGARCYLNDPHLLRLLEQYRRGGAMWQEFGKGFQKGLIPGREGGRNGLFRKA